MQFLDKDGFSDIGSWCWLGLSESEDIDADFYADNDCEEPGWLETALEEAVHF